MSASAGFPTTLYTTGAPVAMTGEATTDDGTHGVFQVTNAAKRIIDPAHDVAVYVNGSPVSGAKFVTVNHLFGIITIASALSPGDVVTIDAYYCPRLQIATGKSAGFTTKRDYPDATVFNAVAARTKQIGLKDFEISLELLEDSLTDHDPGAGLVTLQAALLAGTPFLVEVLLGGTGSYWRGWGLIQQDDLKAPVDGMVSSAVKLVGLTRISNHFAVSGLYGDHVVWAFGT